VTRQPSEIGSTRTNVTPGAGLLEEAPVLGAFPAGTTAGPLGLRSPVDGALVVVAAADGTLAVAGTDGTTVASLGPAADPLWSPLGRVLLFADLASGSARVAVWDRDTGAVTPVGAPSDAAVVDLPAGWIDAALYYLRTFPDRPGELELHRADYDGANDAVVWRGSGLTLASARPAAGPAGILLPTTDAFLLIGPDGTEGNAGPNPYGALGEPLLSPYGSLVAFPTADGQLVVAATAAPGEPIVALPFTGAPGAGFAWAPSGERFAVLDGGTLAVYASDTGALLGSASAAGPVAGPGWAEDGIRYLAGDPPALHALDPAALPAPE
jgi:hypothetical protein